MSGPPPLAPVPGLTPAGNPSTKKRKPSPNHNQPPNKRHKPNINQAQQSYAYSTPQHAQYANYHHPQYQQHPQHPQHPQYQRYHTPGQGYQHPHHSGYRPSPQPPNQSHPNNTNSTKQYYQQQPPPNSTKQYYQQHQTPKGGITKHPQPPMPNPIKMSRLSSNNNKLPQAIMVKIIQAEEKAKSDNKDNKEYQYKKPKMLLGKCTGYMFGFIHQQNAAQPGEVKISFRENDHKKRSSKQRQNIIIEINSMDDTYLGQADNKLVNVFGNALKNEYIELKGRIVDVDLNVMKRKLNLPANKFVRRLLIEVSCEYDKISQIVDLTRKKCKAWKWNEKSKQVILRYFEGEDVEYDALYDDVMDSIALNETYSGNLETLEANFNAAFEKDITAEDLDGIDAYEEIVSTKLLQHQRIGIEWMSLRENFDGDDDDELPPFYKEIEDKETGDIKYINQISDEEIDDLPEIGCGGILADDMGLGKTLQCISLIATNSGFKDDPNGNGPTLIIAPLTVIGNWVGQIGDHCHKDSFRIMVYHGPNREKDLDIIKSHHIVITTYDIVALEYSDETDENREEMRKHYGCGLQYINWLRVVLDEAHKIRSRKTRVFKACNALQAKSRWCLSGTPVQNRLDDLYSLFCFLKLQPICDKAFWNKFVIQPLKNNNHIGFDRLRKVMKQLCLRRDKSMEIDGKPIITIPPKVKNTRIIDFIPEERLRYNRLMAMQKEAFTKLRQGGDQEIMRNFSSVLSMLLRLRQACAHMALVPELNNKSSLSNLDLNIDTVEDANQECASCGMTPECATLTTCNHVYCKDCFLYELEINNGSFPCTLCGDKLSNKSVAEQREKSEDVIMNEEEQKNDEEDEEDDGEKKKKKKRYTKFVVPDGRIEPSTKMLTLINDVKSWKGKEAQGAPHKAVVFSQWTSVLDLLAKCLDQEEILYERLDGSMSRSLREAAMDNFRKDECIPVFLMSLKAGNLGVNMTVANHVYMLDPWWNPATEDQAVDRVYRLGQKRNVTINHFVIKDSVEEKILKIQERKRKLISSALGLKTTKEDAKDRRKKEWLEDLKELFTSK